MRVRIKLFAHFRDGRFKEAEQELPEGTRCRDVILGLGLTLGEMGIVMVNNQHAPHDHPLRNLDTLALFPMVGGG